MNRILSSLAAAAAVSAACVAAIAADTPRAPSFADPLDVPAMKSPLAPRAPVNALARAGKRLVAVGQRGHILFSDDSGDSWQQASVPVSVDLTALAFATPQLGWAAGHDGVILHSSDAGATWQRQSDGRDAAKTDDRPLLALHFSDAAHGIAVGAFGLARCTEDGGAHWQACEERLDNPQGMHLNAIAAIGDAIYIAGEQGVLLKQAAGSQRFTALQQPYKGSLFGIAGSGSKLLAFGLRGNAFYSDDNGLTWNQADTGVRSGLSAGAALPDGSWLLVSQAGQLLRSEGGLSFKQVAGVAPEPATALLAVAPGRLVVGGVRGLRVETK
ncbi:YCF48-related protein [Pseudoduganella sp. OTU4001]|uniref:YCF48-related protein n=1 Tax=Pseudoduganella sp. OTU4001 TaxID=3043854 RepID=UPI00313EF05C